jgi:hypothetical protein
MTFSERDEIPLPQGEGNSVVLANTYEFFLTPTHPPEDRAKGIVSYEAVCQ